MPEELARALVVALHTYLVVGVLVALPFALRGVGRVDPRARGAGLGFRLAILPGSAALWPLVLRRWLQGAPPEERNAHRGAPGRRAP